MSNKSSLLISIKISEIILLFSAIGAYFVVSTHMFKPVASLFIGFLFLFLFIEGALTGVAEVRMARIEKKQNYSLYMFAMTFHLLMFVFLSGYFIYKIFVHS